jgi:hypothetical protein
MYVPIRNQQSQAIFIKPKKPIPLIYRTKTIGTWIERLFPSPIKVVGGNREGVLFYSSVCSSVVVLMYVETQMR